MRCPEVEFVVLASPVRIACCDNVLLLVLVIGVADSKLIVGESLGFRHLNVMLLCLCQRSLIRQFLRIQPAINIFI